MNYFEEQLLADQSVRELQQLIDSIYGWMEKNRYHSKQTVERFEKVQNDLSDHHRNVLFLAEFSRGKTELINATIFGDQGARLLPSSPGRTTRCTTVLQYEQSELPSIRLLPTHSPEGIQKQPLSMLIEDSAPWHNTLFSLHDRKAVKKAFSQIAEALMVSPKTAQALGYLEDTSEQSLAELDIIDDRVAIPKWRHAIINYPHSLLKSGLRILDTPGLNALGVEPGLTLQSLSSAHAIVFVLSADTGITRSEMKLWREHIKSDNNDNVIVVLNKVDQLWDELKSREEIDADIRKQVSDVARILGLPQDQVFPVSAQRALLGRARNEQRWIKASGIQRYEQALADTINYSNQQRIVQRAVEELSPCLETIHSILKRHIKETKSHVEDLESLQHNRQGVASASLDKIKRDVDRHTRVRKRVLALKNELRNGYSNFVRGLDLLFLDRMIASYRFEISNQLTTPGLQREMNDFHGVAVERFRAAMSNVVALEKKIAQTFKDIERILDVSGLTPRRIEPQIYIDMLKKLQASHRKHSHGLGMVVTEQHILRDRYHGSVMIRIRNLYKQTRDDVDRWCRTVIVPLDLELKDRATEIKRRHASLERVRAENSAVQDEISDLEQRIYRDRQSVTTLEHFLRRLTECGERMSRNPGNVISLNAASSVAR